MEGDHSERWIVGFLYRLSTITGALLFIFYSLWWLVSVSVGVMTAANPGWGVTQWIVAILSVITLVLGFDELLNEASIAWHDWDWIDRVVRALAVVGVASWLIWFADWKFSVLDLETFLSRWSIEWVTVKGILVGAFVAIALLMCGRLTLISALYIWRFIFWLIAGERWDSKRAGF